MEANDDGKDDPPGAHATPSEPVYPIRPSILQHPTQESTTSDAHPDAEVPDDVHVLDAKPEWDFRKGWGLYRTKARQYNVVECMGNLPTCVNAHDDLRNARWMIVEYPGDNHFIARKLMETLPHCLMSAPNGSASFLPSVMSTQDAEDEIASMLD